MQDVVLFVAGLSQLKWACAFLSFVGVVFSREGAKLTRLGGKAYGKYFGQPANPVHLALFRTPLIAVTLLLLASCNAQRNRMEQSLNSYIGGSVADFAADHGYPSSTVKVADNEAAFRWVITGQGPGAIVPVGGSLIVAPPSPRVCTVQLRATTSSPSPDLKDWVIRSWRWQGAC